MRHKVGIIGGDGIGPEVVAEALKVVAAAEPRLKQEANAIFETMDFGFYYDPNAKADMGLIRGGFWVEKPPDCSILDNYRDGGPDVASRPGWLR